MSMERSGWLAIPWRLLGRLGERGAVVLELARDETWSTRVGAPALEVRCCSGMVLVTIEGDPEDHVLPAGATLRPERAGRLAVWALEPARVRVEERRATVRART